MMKNDEIKILNEIITLKDKIKDIKMKKGEFVKSYIMSISHLRDQFQRVGENVPNGELFIVPISIIPPIFETFITTISKNNVLPSFDEILGKLTQEESMMVSRGRIQKHQESLLLKIRK